MERLPVALPGDEASYIVDRLNATAQLCTKLMSGSGLRVGKHYIFISTLKQKIECVERQLASDINTGRAAVYLPNTLATQWQRPHNNERPDAWIGGVPPIQLL